jgi:hypothetical protein
MQHEEILKTTPSGRKGQLSTAVVHLIEIEFSPKDTTSKSPQCLERTLDVARGMNRRF